MIRIARCAFMGLEHHVVTLGKLDTVLVDVGGVSERDPSSRCS